MRNFLFEEMTAHEIKERCRTDPLVVVPTGSTEQHGPHLAVKTDSLLVKGVVEAALEIVKDKGINVLVLPVLPFGSSDHHLPYGGTVSLSPRHYSLVVGDIVRSLIEEGFKRIFFVNGHGGNTAPIAMALTEAKLKYPNVLLAACDYWNVAAADIEALERTPSKVTGHACEIETSLALYFDEESVRMDRLVEELPSPRFKGESFNLIKKGSVSLYSTFQEMTRGGQIGDPTYATKETGEAMAEAITLRLAEVIVQLSSCPITAFKEEIPRNMET